MALEMPGGLASYQDYAALDDGNRYQVIDGVLVMTPSPGFRHQEIVHRLQLHLGNHVSDRAAGKLVAAPLDVVLRSERPAVVVQPDLVYISNARKSIITPANVQGAPDLVVEVLSPSTAMLDLTRKKGLYEEHGVVEYWVLNPETDSVEVFNRGPDGKFERGRSLTGSDTLTSPLFPGFAVRVEAIFPGD